MDWAIDLLLKHSRRTKSTWKLVEKKLKHKYFLEWIHWKWEKSIPSIQVFLFTKASSSSVRNLPAMQETWVWFLGQEDSLEKEMATHSSILAWRIPWTEEPWQASVRGVTRVGHDLRTKPPFTKLFLQTWSHFNPMGMHRWDWIPAQSHPLSNLCASTKFFHPDHRRAVEQFPSKQSHGW